MVTIELQLDAETLARVQRLAKARNSTLEELIKEMLEQIEDSGATDDPLLGLFSDEASLIDQIVESAMGSREEHPLRQTSG